MSAVRSGRLTGVAARYASAFLLAAAAQLARLPLEPATSIPFISYVPFIVLGASLGGLGPGLAATALCCLESAYFATAPVYSFRIGAPHSWLGLASLAFSGVIASVLFHRLRLARHALAAANQELAMIQANVPAALMVVDDDLRVRKANAFAARLTGTAPAGMAGILPGDALGCLNALANPGGCGAGPSCGQCPIRTALVDSVRTGTRHDNVEAWLPLFIAGERQSRCMLVSAVPFEFDGRRRTLVWVQDITGTKRAENTLRQQAAMIDLSRDAIVSAGADRVIRGWNRGAEEMYGWTEAEAVGHTIHSLLGACSSVTTAELDEILARNGHWEGELLHSRRDGSQVVADSRQVLMRDQAGVPAGILEINRDITARTRAAEALRASEERFRAAFEHAAIGMFIVSVEGRVTSANNAVCAMLGYTREELTGKRLHEITHPEDLAFTLDTLQSMASNQPDRATFIKRYLHKEGFTVWSRVVSATVRGPAGSPPQFITQIEDITDRKRAEEAVLQAAQQRRLELEAAELGAWDYRFDVGSVHWDERCRNMFGVASGEQIDYGRAIDAIHPEDRLATQEAIEQALAGAGGGAYHQEHRVVWPDGSIHWIASHGRAYLNSENCAGRFIGVNMEITERKRREEALRNTVSQLESALTEKTVLLREVHHRVKNNLAVISSLLGMQASATGSPEAQRALEDSQERVQSIAMIHEHLYGNEHLDRIDLSEFARELAADLYVAYRDDPERVSFDVEGAPIEVGVHRAVPCGLILHELVSNAFKYAFPNGRRGRVRVVCEEIGLRTVRLTVSDDGAGMPEGFDWQRSNSLGLQIVQILTKQLGGTIEMTRENGTRFDLVFQYSAPQAATVDAPKIGAVAAGQ